MDAVAGLDAYLTSIPATHDETCNCVECHAWHVESRMVVFNADRPDFPCCRDERAEQIAEGRWCKAQPVAHADLYMAWQYVNGKYVVDPPGRCLECEHEAKEKAS